MRDLKVPVNPRYMLTSGKDGLKGSVGINSENNNQDRNGRAISPPRIDFDDLNLHQVEKDELGEQSKNGTIHSSMCKVSPSIRGNNEGDRLGSVILHQKPTIPTASAMKEEELSLIMKNSSEV